MSDRHFGYPGTREPNFSVRLGRHLRYEGGTTPTELKEVVEDPSVSQVQDTDLLDIDPDALREAERVFAQGILDTMPGKLVARASYEDTRVVLTMTDGSEYYFYGFMGEARAT